MASATERPRLPEGTVKLAGDGLRARGGAGYRAEMTPVARSPYAGHRFPPEVISHAVWLHFRFPLGLRMVKEMPAARGIVVSHETIGQQGAEVRSDVRQPDSSSAASCRRQVAPGRGPEHD